MRSLIYEITITAIAVALTTLGVLLAVPAIEILGLVVGAIGFGMLVERAITD